MDDNVSRFLEAIKGDRFERVFIVDLFSGLRQSEIIGLRWSDVDLDNGLLTIRHQIQKSYSDSGYIFLDETKNGKQRIVAVTPSIVRVLKAQRVQQMEWRLAAGPSWDNPLDLVFTDELGGHLKHRTIINHFKKIVASIGLENTRFPVLSEMPPFAIIKASPLCPVLKLPLLLLSVPSPMPAPAPLLPLPPVAVTLPPLMTTVQPAPLLPLPMPAPEPYWLPPPVAFTVPPLMVTAVPAVEPLPLPIPAPWPSTTLAVTSPPLMVTLPPDVVLL